MNFICEAKILVKKLTKNDIKKEDIKSLAKAIKSVPKLLLPDYHQKVFCLNGGSCGSSYITELLKVNGWSNCYHEKRPDLDNEGILHFEGRLDVSYLKLLLRWTRHRVRFEANNRLFSMGQELMQLYPTAKFIHLYRDGRSVVTSAMNIAKPELTWGSSRLRYRSAKLCGSLGLSNFEKSCNYWTRYNQRIMDDLSSASLLRLKFEDLVAGKVDELAQFLGTDLRIRQIPPVNHRKPKKTGNAAFPSYADWGEEYQQRFWELCGPVMASLGYTR